MVHLNLMNHRAYRLILLGLVSLVFPALAQAYINPIPRDLGAEVLSESVPTAFAPHETSPEDYLIEWVGKPLPNLQFSLAKRSLEWVRVAEVLVIPRARLVLSATGIESGKVTASGFSQSFVIRGGLATAELPVALISGDENLIELQIRNAGQPQVNTGKLRIRFRPRQKPTSAVYFDTSCSRFGLAAQSRGESGNQWAYVGCRLVNVEGAEYRTSSLELYLFWDGVGQTIELGGIETRSTIPSLWTLRQRAEPGRVLIKAGNQELELTYRIPEHLHHLTLGLGLGAYQFIFQSSTEDVSTVAAMPTFYGSYFITETMRLVAFGATVVHQQLYSDLGIYLNTEYIRTLDRRLSINILLGGNLVGFKNQGDYILRLGAPQGIEMIYSDFLGRARNLSVGAFIYPSINNKAYYNVWVRWGSSKLFGELNYISWRNHTEHDQFFSRSLGVTFGFPLGLLL